MPNVFPTAPNYDDVRWPAKGGLRVPQEAGAATLEVYSEVDLGTPATTVKLTPAQAAASLIVITPSANTTLILPGCQPGNGATVANLAAFTVTIQVGTNTTNTAVIPASAVQSFIQTGYNLGAALVA